VLESLGLVREDEFTGDTAIAGIEHQYVGGAVQAKRSS
jgi:hypothetical protein